MSNELSVPPKGAPGLALGRELHDLAAFDGPTDDVLQARHRFLEQMLASDPFSVFELVSLPATATDNLLTALVIRDDIRLTLARAADGFERDHGLPPIDSAAAF